MKEKIFNNLSWKLASGIIALVIWAVIVNIYDPNTSVTISNIAVELLNTQTLTDKGMTYEVVDGGKISVYIKGPKSIITEIKSSDIVATADVGNNMTWMDYADISVKVVKDGVDTSSIEVIPRTTAVRLKVDNRETKEFPIKYEYEGTPAAGYSIGYVNVFPESVRVIGSSEAVNNISSAKVTVNANGRNANFTENLPIRFVDAAGNQIVDDSLTVSITEAECTTVVYLTKSVKVRVGGTAGKVADGFMLRDVVISKEEIDIIGPANIVEHINEIVIPSSAIDVTGAASTRVFSVNIADFADTAISFKSDSMATVTARVVDENSRVYTIPAKDIMFSNVLSGYEAKVSSEVENVQISIIADGVSLDDITAKDIIAVANLNALSAGEHIVTLTVVTPAGYKVSGEYTTKIVIQKKSSVRPPEIITQPVTEEETTLSISEEITSSGEQSTNAAAEPTEAVTTQGSDSQTESTKASEEQVAGN